MSLNNILDTIDTSGAAFWSRSKNTYFINVRCQGYGGYHEARQSSNAQKICAALYKCNEVTSYTINQLFDNISGHIVISFNKREASNEN